MTPERFANAEELLKEHMGGIGDELITYVRELEADKAKMIATAKKILTYVIAPEEGYGLDLVSRINDDLREAIDNAKGAE